MIVRKREEDRIVKRRRKRRRSRMALCESVRWAVLLLGAGRNVWQRLMDVMFMVII